MTLSEITLTRTYFLAKEEDLPRCYQRYLERVERVKQFTTVYLVADVEFYEVDSVVKENLLHDLQAQSDEPVNEDEWNMYSYSTALGTIDEPIEPGAAVSRLWEDMLLTDDEEWPRSFISTVNFRFLVVYVTTEVTNWKPLGAGSEVLLEASGPEHRR